MSELVDRLCEGNHPVVACVGPEKTASAFKECLDRKFVRIKFTATRGGTELGIRLDESALDTSEADFDNAQGKVHVAGDLTLDYVRVRLIADIDLQTLEGEGHLEKIAAEAEA